MNWRDEAKSLGIPMYRRTKVDVLADIEAKKNKPAGKTKVVITRQEAVNVCCAALKTHAASKGLDPDKEILVSRWYLQMNRNNMTFIGQELDMTKINKDEPSTKPEVAPTPDVTVNEPTEETEDGTAGSESEPTEAVDSPVVPETI